jgi:cytochrome P450
LPVTPAADEEFIKRNYRNMNRIDTIKRHLTSNTPNSPPVVFTPPSFSQNPLPFLQESKRKFPDMFKVRRSSRDQGYTVIADPTLFEDVLTYEDIYGNPQTDNMRVNERIFKIPQDTLENHEERIIKKLRQFLLRHCDDLADDIAKKVLTYMEKNMGDEGVMDMRDIGTAVFWPMTEALFGSAASEEEAPHLLRAFDEIDGKFGKALRGRVVPEVETGVRDASKVFASSVRRAKDGKCPMAPLLRFYDDELGGKDADLTAKFATAAWWGGQGNTLPSTVWTFGLLLSNPEWRRRTYEEVDRHVKSLPGPDGKFDFEKLSFITAALKESLRLKTYSIAWRIVKKDTVMEAKSGRKYLLKRGELLGLHFCLRHMDESIYPQPEIFRPTRFLKETDESKGHAYAWAPFSAGFHKCSGYPLAMLEIPVVIALMFREYELTLLDPLPGMDYKQAFGVVGPKEGAVRVRYRKRRL